MSGTQGSGHSAARLGPGAGPCWTRAAWLPQCPAPRLGRPWVSDSGCPRRVGAARGGRDPADLVTGPVRPRLDPGRPRTSPPASKNLAGQGSSDQIEHPGRAWGLCRLEQAQTPPLPSSALPTAETWAASSAGPDGFPGLVRSPGRVRLFCCRGPRPLAACFCQRFKGPQPQEGVPRPAAGPGTVPAGRPVCDLTLPVPHGF